MNREKMPCRLAMLMWVGAALLLVGCGPTGETGLSPEDESATRVAQQVAEAEAVAATLTAKAVSEQLGTPAPADTSTPVPTITPPPTSPPEASEPTATNTPATPLCTVASGVLNVRSGPGLVYDPPLFNLPAGTELTPVAFNGAGNPGGRWVEIQIISSGQSGWVSADPQFVTCNIDLTTLPFAEGPPPPTPTSTNTPIPAQPTPTPSPTPPNFFAITPGGGPNQQLQGFVQFPGYGPNQLDKNDLVFGERLSFRVVAFDVSTGRTEDGAGIGQVEFRIEDIDGNPLYEKTETNHAYCLLGSDDPNCPPYIFSQHGYAWPNGTPVDPEAHYFAKITIRPLGREHDDEARAEWDFDFRISGVPSPTQSQLQAEIIQTGLNHNDNFVSGALVFRVRANNPDVGNNDGAGIQNVELRILRNGQRVYDHTENNAGYCLFGGGDNGGDCNTWVFSEHNYEWPNGRQIEPGPYTLEAEVRAGNGQRKTIRRDIQIEP